MEQIKNEIVTNKIEAKKKEDDYTLYNYLIEHPTLLVSIISAFVIIITFIFNCVIYVSTCNYLKYWGINVEFVNINTSNKIYLLAIMSVYYFVSCILQQFLMLSFEKYTFDMEDVFIAKSWEIELKRLIQKNGICKSICKKFLKCCSAEKTQLDKLKIEIDMHSYQFNEALELLKDRKKNTKKKCKKKIWPSLLIVMVILVIIFCILFLTVISNINIPLALLVSGFGACAIISCSYFSNFWLHKRKRIKEIRRAIREKIEKSDYSIIFKGVKNDEYPLKKLLNLQFREFFNNSGMATFVYMAVTLVFCMFLILYPVATKSTEDKKLFQIVYEDEAAYAIIYANDNFYYLEEVSEDGDVLTVYKSKQRVLKKDDISYMVKEFKIVNWGN